MHLDKKVVEEVLKYVDNAGGPEKIKRVRNAFLAAGQQERSQELLRGIAETNEGANSLVAAALLGLTLALVIQDSAATHH